jgi:hypothetical protein
MQSISDNRAYTNDGVTWRWVSNNTPVPLDAAKEHGIPVEPVAQQALIDADTIAFVAAYRQRMANHVHSAEELNEMRAAFGPGATVVNVITGKSTKL